MTSYRWTQHRVFDAAGNDKTGPAALSLWWIARAAAEETLQGVPLIPAWLKLFRTQLSVKESSWFRWRGDFAESAEIRRAYSGLYGRFVARALLSHHLGLELFVPLKRNRTAIAGSVEVRRTSKGDIPDWLAWDHRRSRFVLGEAKGSLSSGDFTAPDGPKCVHQGKAQFSRVEVRDGARVLKPDQWVAAIRWSTDARGGVPTTVLWDPPSDDEPFSPAEAEQHRAAMGRAWLDTIAPGLGWRGADDLMSTDRASAAVMIRAAPGAAPSGSDWPSLDEDPDPDQGTENDGAPQVESDQSVPDLVALTLGDGLLESDVYEDRLALDPTAGAPSLHEAAYIVAVATRFGIRPVRSLAEFDTLRREQERALRLEEPAMLIGLPLDFDPTKSPDRQVWLGDAGISVPGGLALFDLRRVIAEPLERIRPA